MVDDSGQIFTIEGVAGAILIITTVYIVLSTTYLLTPGETHIYDMQLEQLGNDVLAVMDSPLVWTNPYPKSPLEQYVEGNQPDYFAENFTRYCNETWAENDRLQFNASVVYRDSATGAIDSMYFAGSPYLRENAVKVTRWVNINGTVTPAMPWDDRNQSVLLEVLLWRG